MFVGQKDAADQHIALPHHPDLRGRLDEIERLEGKQQLARNAAGITTRLGGKGNLPLAAQRFFVRVEHQLLSPGLQDRILGIADAEARLFAGPAAFRIAYERASGIGPDRTVPRTGRRLLPIRDVRLPTETGRAEMGDRVLLRRLRRGSTNEQRREKSGNCAAILKREYL